MTSQKNNLKKNRILIVDDVPENLRLLANILENEQYMVQKAKNGKLAISTSTANPPDLILLEGYSKYFVLENN